jgi:hypothetical protein
MAKTARFNIGFLQLDQEHEELFLSVTPGFEHGPGIQRDGLTSPRMSDPHSVPRIRNHFQLSAGPTLPSTVDPYVQRAGTWTLYHHLKHFIAARGSDWTIVGVQSNGDLTMNPWHVAYLGNSHIPNQDGALCALLTENEPQEPVGSRIYRSLIKWADPAAAARKVRYECLKLQINETTRGHAVKISDPDLAGRYDMHLANVGAYNHKTKDLAPLIEFTLSGKPLVEDGVELSLSNVIDRFEDIRHIFNLPTVPARGFFRNQEVQQLNFAEYQLFANLNERRAALFSPVIVDLDIDGRVAVRWQDAAEVLRKRHFKMTPDSPSRRGEFRLYSDQSDHDKVEIFLPHNVYPFGVIGLQESSSPDAGGSVVCLSSGGLSGRVGNTLEGIARIMFDFFGCIDAMVLDEGYDVFFMANPTLDGGGYKYNNTEILKKVLAFTKKRVDHDHKESLKVSQSYATPGGMKEFPLNKELLDEIENDSKMLGLAEYDDVMLVEPQRSQMRSVLIFAARTPSA